MRGSKLPVWISGVVSYTMDKEVRIYREEVSPYVECRRQAAHHGRSPKSRCDGQRSCASGAPRRSALYGESDQPAGRLSRVARSPAIVRAIDIRFRIGSQSVPSYGFPSRLQRCRSAASPSLIEGLLSVSTVARCYGRLTVAKCDCFVRRYSAVIECRYL